VSKDDVLKEARAADILCNKKHKHIVPILRHGWLSSSYYFFDMQPCDMNLEDYISDKYKDKITFEGTYTSRIFTILSQITSGVHFIHKHKQVHRDLKPKNGTSLVTVESNISAVLPQRSNVEDRRFRFVR
jgi:serine/threonine protein kinase